jgi:hypothetical protein
MKIEKIDRCGSYGIDRTVKVELMIFTDTLQLYLSS